MLKFSTISKLGVIRQTKDRYTHRDATKTVFGLCLVKIDHGWPEGCPYLHEVK